MNCTSVLHAFSHPQPSVIPVDLAMCLSQRQPLYQLLSMSPLKTTQHRSQPTECPPRSSFYSQHPSLRSSTLSLPSSHVPSQPRSCFRRDSCGVNKKRVVFADAIGLALTAVRLFIPEPSSPDFTLMMRPSAVKQEGQQLPLNKLQRHKLRLGFPQPTVDFKTFLARLREMHVQLESCSISEHCLSGKVCTSRVSNESSAHVRVTFDSWRSHHDVPCMFLEQRRCGGSDVDVFSFDLSLPKNIDPKERIEFCVSFTPASGSTTQWDDNRGQNYRLYLENTQGNMNFCYPTLPKQRPPSWPSQVSTSTQNCADVLCLQGALSNRVRAEIAHLCSIR